MGYEGEFRHTTIQKFMLSCNWRYLCHIVLHFLSSRKSELPNIPELDDVLDLVHLNAKVFINMRKNHSKSTFSCNEIMLFDNMLGFTYGASSSSSSSSSESDGDNDNDGDGGDDEHDNNVVAIGEDEFIFYQEDLRTTQGSSPPLTPNAALHRVVEGLTTLVTSLSTIVADQAKEIIRLEQKNKKLKYAESSSKPKSFKRLVKGPSRNDKGKAIMIEQDDEPSIKNKLSKEFKEELSRKAIEDILSQDYYDEVDDQMKRKNPSVITSEAKKSTPEVIKSTQETEKDATQEIDETAKKVLKSTFEVSKETQMTVPEVPTKIPKNYSFKEEINSKMSVNMVEDCVKEIKSKMSSEELEKDKLVFYLKANNYKNKQLKNMKIEKLKALVEQMKKDKAESSEKIVQPEIVIQQERELEISKNDTQALIDHSKNLELMDEKLLKLREINKEIDKKRKIDVSSGGYRSQSAVLAENIKELDAAKRLSIPHVNVEDISKEIYSTTSTEGSKKVSTKDKASWFKNKPKSSERIIENSDIGIENFSRETLKEKIFSRDLALERGIPEPLRAYEVAQLKCLVYEDILHLNL
ncbi:hypothetical protein L1987_06988 [Smallanthus sonchifolius]|uniref:Uncharacterized protein n=1 Tax=Smallanthus sonchifolius TaxID=185202 RepID=A0ACB9JZV4_9ASTR|nr:hypothetical protein L1987_06988 [Smallanthus sonchifolius]